MADSASNLPVDIEWLIRALHQACGSSSRLVSYQSNRFAESTGFLSRIWRVELEWDNAKDQQSTALPKSVLIKKPSTWKLEEMNQDISLKFDLSIVRSYHNRECHAYQYFNRHEATPPIPLVRCFYAQEALSDSLTDGVLVLEDMTEYAVAKSLGQDFNLKQAFLVVEAIASAHAYSINYPEFLELFGPFPYNVYYHFFDHFETGIDQLLKEHTFCPFSREKLCQLWEEVKSDFMIQIDPSTKGEPAVLCHGDMQVNNILWRRRSRSSIQVINLEDSKPPINRIGASNHPTSQSGHQSDPKVQQSGSEDLTSDQLAAFIDFQIAAPGHPMQDIANVVIWGFPTDLRRKYQMSMIKRYAEVLRSKVKNPIVHSAHCQSSARPRSNFLFSEEYLTQNYYKIIYQFAMVYICGYPVYSKFIKDEMGEEGVKTWVERSFSCIEDYLKLMNRQ